MLTSHSYELAALGVILLCTAQTSYGVSGSSRSLISRQTSTFDPSQIPQGCQDACNSVVDNANTCTTFQCLCTPKNDAAVLSCVDCVISFNHSGPAIIDGQDILNAFASECNLNNVSLSSLSASGVATVTGITTSNLNPPPFSTASSQTSPSASATSPSTSTLSTTSATPSTTSSRASTLRQDAQFFLWPSSVVVAIMVTLAMA
ncbi:hypothetical protein FB451DRAFT_593844 [Mycena latifolia]|nr:hypothetical protein FB451DRAFT_593844 [Mycena latifolia]